VLCEFSSVRSGVTDIALLLGYDAASLCIRLQQFRDSVSYISRPLRTRAIHCIETSGTYYQVPRYHVPDKRSSVSYIFTLYAKNVTEYVDRFRLLLRRSFYFRGRDKRNSACLVLMGDVCQIKDFECWLKRRNCSPVRFSLLEMNNFV